MNLIDQLPNLTTLAIKCQRDTGYTATAHVQSGEHGHSWTLAVYDDAMVTPVRYWSGVLFHEGRESKHSQSLLQAIAGIGAFIEANRKERVV